MDHGCIFSKFGASLIPGAIQIASLIVAVTTAAKL
jgi:hypothetical protein